MLYLGNAMAHDLFPNKTQEVCSFIRYIPLLDNGDRKASCICGPGDEAMSAS